MSGGGSNLQAIIDGIQLGTVRNTEIVAVISSKPNVYALERARAHGIPTEIVEAGAYQSRDEYDAALLRTVQLYQPDLIVLAGFLRTIASPMIHCYKHRIINVHPSLLPAFGGVGYYGLRVHHAVLEHGVQVTGATVHYVDEGIDTGKILKQKAVYVNEDDTAESLQLRVMKEAEWVILPEVINSLATERVENFY